MMTSQPTAVGPVPPFLARQIESVPAPPLPELARLPRPGERDTIFGCSRSWLIETDAELPPEEKFLFRVRSRGKVRGVVFMNVSKFREFMRKAEFEDLHSGAKSEGSQLCPA
jgi:hypothetical protein